MHPRAKSKPKSGSDLEASLPWPKPRCEDDVCNLFFGEVGLGMLQWTVVIAYSPSGPTNYYKQKKTGVALRMILMLTYASHAQRVRRHPDEMSGTGTCTNTKRPCFQSSRFARVCHFAAFCILQRNLVTSFRAMLSRGRAERKHPMKLENCLALLLRNRPETRASEFMTTMSSS